MSKLKKEVDKGMRQIKETMREKPTKPKKRSILYRLNRYLFDGYDGLIGKPFKRKIIWPLERLEWWVKYRTTHRYHVIKPDTLKPGYHDGTTLMLPVIMQIVADYIEIEMAHQELIWGLDDLDLSHWDWKKRLHYKLRRLPFIGSFFRAVLPTFRDGVLGLRRNKWYEELETDPYMGEEFAEERRQEARNIRKIYEWWRDTYPNRPCPMEVSGWSDWCDKLRKEGRGFLESSKPCGWNEYGEVTLYEVDKYLSEEENEKEKEMLEMNRKIEKEYEDEEDEMMHLAVKLHRRLWT